MAQTFTWLSTLLLLATALSGCLGGDDGGDGHGAGDGDHGTDPGTTPGATDGSADSASEWYAYEFDRTVTPKSGGSGKMKSFSYTHTLVQDDARTVVDVDVEVLGTSTESIRVTKMDMSTGDFEGETVSTPLLVHKLRHTFEVVEDGTGERQPGDTSTVTVYLPADELSASATIAWFFVHLGFEDESGSGVWEYYITEEMEAEMNDGNVFYSPFMDGEALDWWGFDFLATAYGLGFFQAYVTGDAQFEPGEWSWGGASYEVKETEFSVGSYSFDGWSVTLSGTDESGTSGYHMVASEDLPIPYEFRFGTDGSSGSGSTDVVEFKLTGLTLG